MGKVPALQPFIWMCRAHDGIRRWARGSGSSADGSMLHTLPWHGSILRQPAALPINMTPALPLVPHREESH